MIRKIIEVQFLYEQKILPSENLRGVLLANNKVFVASEEGPGIYQAQPTNDSNTYLVDLDNDDWEDFLSNHELLIDIIAE